MIPHDDIINNKISENTFAVGFHAVLNNKADDIYRDPSQFFNFTHMTKNLVGIIKSVLIRTTEGEGSPLLVIDTTFGGGKTHTLVALYHLFTTPDIVKKHSEINKILSELRMKNIPDLSLVSIDCHNISSVKSPGKARTIWGEIAKQLGAYDLMEKYDQRLRRPDSSTLESLISSTGKPVLILLDELVNYLKDARAEEVGDQNLAEITVSFFHTITDVISNSRDAMLIITLPGNESAYREEAELLEAYTSRVKEISGREAAFTVPMERSEIYDVIRKRLFREVDQTYASEVAEELQKFYALHPESFPSEVLDLDYRDKIAKSYPFHPVLIDILYERVSTISEFHKTRGVLRLLSHVLKSVYFYQDRLNYDVVITPGIVNLNDTSVFQELTNRIGRGEFQSVINSDIVNDEHGAKCQRIDSTDGFGPAVRIATATYLYSLIGTTKKLSRGCSENELVLATSVDGITYPRDIINDVKDLERTLWYIYEQAGKYYFWVEANINKVIVDEMERIYRPQYDKIIKDRLRKLLLKSDFFDVRVWEHDIRTPHKATLVATNFHEISGSESVVPEGVKTIIDREGSSYRSKKNLMYVLVPRGDRVVRMVEAAKRYLAIEELKKNWKGRKEFRFYQDKVGELSKEADSSLNMVVEYCYSLIYYPKGKDVKCITVADGYEGAKDLPDKVLKALEKSSKIVSSIVPEYFVDRVFGDRREMTVDQLWDTFEEAPMHFLPENKQVFRDAISEGLKEKLFGLYAGGIGDVININESNYQRVGEQFFFGRVSQSGPHDGNYILPKDRSDGIEAKLNEIAERMTSGNSTKAKKISSYTLDTGSVVGGISVVIPIRDVTVEVPASLSEYVGWNLEEMQFSFGNPRVFNSLQSPLSTMLLGIRDVYLSVDAKSRIMGLDIRDAPLSDVNAAMDILYKISSMFNQDLNVSVTIRFGSETQIDEDLIESAKEIPVLEGELEFAAKLTADQG